MRRALRLARRGWGRVAPNPLVGAVVVANNEIVGEGWHAEFGGAHAETVALTAAGARARGATLYVTLEPCNHVGKTPPCSDAVIASGVARVVLAARDPNPVASGGVTRLVGAGIEVCEGVLETDARELNAPFFNRSNRPWVTLKLALSLDGAIADASRTVGWMTSEQSRRAVHRLRASADAIAVGAGTARADDPALTVRYGTPPRRMPLRVVFDRRCQLALESALVRSAGVVPVLVVVPDAPRNSDEAARRRALVERGVQLVAAETLEKALGTLRTSGVHHLLVEGGAALAGSLLNANLVDRLIIFQAPIILGGSAVGAFSGVQAHSVSESLHCRVVTRRQSGVDTMTTYAVSQS